MTTFSDAGLYYLDSGKSIDIELWWGDGDDHGAVFVMARYHYEQLGPLGFPGVPDPEFAFTTSNFTKRTRFSLLEEVAGESGDVIDYLDPYYIYRVTITNTGPPDTAFAAAFSLEGMTSA